MKKIYILIVAAFLCSSSFFTASAYSADFSLGVSTWYAWWEPCFKKLMTNPEKSSYELYRETARSKFHMYNPDFMYGPIMSLKFAESWTITGVFMMGFGYNSTTYTYSYWNDFTTPLSELRKVRIGHQEKYDLDIAINYSIIPVLKLFLGLKYQGYKSEGKYYIVDKNVPPAVWTGRRSGDIDFNSYSIGPGMGLGMTVRLVQNLFLLGNISGLFMHSKGDIDIKEKVNYFPLTIALKTTSYYYILGLNANSSLAYYIEQIRTTISLGFRYQMLHYIYQKGERKNLDGQKDHFYGFMLSVIYTF